MRTHWTICAFPFPHLFHIWRTRRFLYGLLRGMPLPRCARLGCLAGAAAVRAVGAELHPPEILWLQQRMAHLVEGGAAAGVERGGAGPSGRTCSVAEVAAAEEMVSRGEGVEGEGPSVRRVAAAAMAEEVYREMLDAQELIDRIGVGVVYFGSARLDISSPYW